MVEAENAAVEEKVNDAKVKDRNAKKVAHKVEKQSQNEKEYRKLAVGYSLPIKVMPSQRKLGEAGEVTEQEEGSL